MSWGTDFTAEIFLQGHIFYSKYELENKIKEIEILLQDYKSSIKMYAISNIRDIIPEDWKEDSVDYISSKIDELMEYYDETCMTLINLNHYLESNPDFNKKDDKQF